MTRCRAEYRWRSGSLIYCLDDLEGHRVNELQQPLHSNGSRLWNGIVAFEPEATLRRKEEEPLPIINKTLLLSKQEHQLVQKLMECVDEFDEISQYDGVQTVENRKHFTRLIKDAQNSVLARAAHIAFPDLYGR